jgi:hypothetical protein
VNSSDKALSKEMIPTVREGAREKFKTKKIGFAI